MLYWSWRGYGCWAIIGLLGPLWGFSLLGRGWGLMVSSVLPPSMSCNHLSWALGCYWTTWANTRPLIVEQRFGYDGVTILSPFYHLPTILLLMSVLILLYIHALGLAFILLNRIAMSTLSFPEELSRKLVHQ